MQRWREKVYDCLVTNKRYELIVKENVRAFKAERAIFIKEKEEKEERLKVTEAKEKALDIENEFLKQKLRAMEREMQEVNG